MKSQKVVQTEFRGPTDTKPSRVRVKNVTTGKTSFVSWEPGLQVQENHKRAAAHVLGFEPEWYASVDGGLGYLFGGSYRGD